MSIHLLISKQNQLYLEVEVDLDVDDADHDEGQQELHDRRVPSEPAEA